MPIPLAAIGSIAGPLFNLVDDLFTSDEERAAAKARLVQLEQQGQLDTLKTSLSAIMAEAQSKDPWTSRARPSFLYVIYFMLLMSVPMGVLFWYNPTAADAVIQGFNGWLNAIPGELYALFGAGYMGYAGVRSWEKGKGLTK